MSAFQGTTQPSQASANSGAQHPTPPPPTSRPPTVEDDDEVDDSDDDDLDDLLDEFNETAKLLGSASTVPGGEGGDAEEEFADELQKGMADLLGELESSPELQQQFEHLVKELSDAASKDPSQVNTTAGPSSTPTPPAPNFSDTINRTMNRLQESGETISSDIADSETDDFLAEMLKQMGSMSGMGDSEEDFSKMLLNMMEQLTNKDILYEPMRELADKYPAWLEKNTDKYTAEEIARYRDQYGYVKDIVRKFEEPTYKDSSTTDREYIVEKMQKMQSAGSPPAELMGGMGEGLDVPPDVENSCPVQ